MGVKREETRAVTKFIKENKHMYSDDLAEAINKAFGLNLTATAAYNRAMRAGVSLPHRYFSTVKAKLNFKKTSVKLMVSDWHGGLTL